MFKIAQLFYIKSVIGENIYDIDTPKHVQYKSN